MDISVAIQTLIYVSKSNVYEYTGGIYILLRCFFLHSQVILVNRINTLRKMINWNNKHKLNLKYDNVYKYLDYRKIQPGS